MSTCTWHVPKPIPQQRRKTILRGLDTQLDFFLHVRDILAGNSSVGAGLRRSPEQSRLRSLSGETSTSSPRAPYVSLPSESARPSVIKDLFALPGPSPPFRNRPLDSAMVREEEKNRARKSQVAPSASITPANRAPYESPPRSANAFHSFLIDPLEEEKRAPECQAASSASKMQTTKAGGVAVPGTVNSLRNICMKHWNTQQPGGQGLAADFDAYFKTLSKEDKAPFMRELRKAQGVARKAARIVAKKTEIVSTIN